MRQTITINSSLATHKFHLTAILMTIILAAGYFFNLKPLIQQWLVVRSNNHHLLQQIAQDGTKTSHLAKTLQEVEKLQTSLQNILQKYNALSVTTDTTDITDNQNVNIPYSLEFSAQQKVFGQIAQAATSAGLAINSFKPLPENNVDFMHVTPIQVTVTGGYFQLIDFIDMLNKLNLLVTFPDFTITHTNSNLSTGMNNTAGKTDQLTMSLKLNLYNMNNKEKNA